MKCVRCIIGSTRVFDSRKLEDGGVRRLRRCLRCANTFTTHEVVVDAEAGDALKLETRRVEPRAELNARKRTERLVRDAAKLTGQTPARVRAAWGLKPGETMRKRDVSKLSEKDRV